MKSIFLFISLLFGLMLPFSALAQTTTDIPFDTINWVFPGNYKITEFEGKEALLIMQNGTVFKYGAKAYLKDYKFSDGIIEFDFYSPHDDFTFLGFFFRFTTHNDEDRYELFFFQPTRTSYLPVNNGIIHLSCYDDGIYKRAGNIEPQVWHHIRAEIDGPHVVVYMDDEENITINNLGRGLSKGSIGLWAGETTSRCYFANFKVTQ